MELTVTIAPAAATARFRASSARSRGTARKRRVPAVAREKAPPVRPGAGRAAGPGRAAETTRAAEARKPSTVPVKSQLYVITDSSAAASAGENRLSRSYASRDRDRARV